MAARLPQHPFGVSRARLPLHAGDRHDLPRALRWAHVAVVVASASCAARSEAPPTSLAPQAAYHVRALPQPVRGPGADALQRVLAAQQRALALPVVGDGRLSELARLVEPGAGVERLQRVAASLGLVDGQLSIHELQRGPDGSWRDAAEDVLRDALALGRPTHYGAFVWQQGRARVVLAVRPPALDPVPREVSPGQAIRLRGRVPGSSGEPVIEVIDPDGAYRALPAGGGPDFDVQLRPRSEGTYRITLRAASARPLARMAIDVGHASSTSVGEREARPLPAARAFYDAVEVMRDAAGLGPLEVAPELERVAAGGPPMQGRLVLHGRVAGASAEALRRALQRDPACRTALTHAQVTHVGIHVARARSGGFELTLLTARFSAMEASELSAARVLDGINRTRRARGAGPLVPDTRLGEVARRTAALYLRGELASEQAMVDATNVELERFSIAYRRVAAVVALVERPAEVEALEPALDPDARVVGVGLARRPVDNRADAHPFAVVLALGWTR